MYKVMLDTCALVNFFLVYSKKDKGGEIPPSLKKYEELLDKFETGKFLNVMSQWSKLELRNVVRLIRLEQKFVESGYSTREFGDARKEIFLTPEENKLVNQAIFDIWKYCIRETKSLTEGDFRKIENLSKKGFEFMDLILILQSKKNKCDFFITKDTQLKKTEKLSKEFNIKIIGINEFLDKLK